MPIVGLIETPKQMPGSITEAVLGKNAGGGGAVPEGFAAPAEKH
jgi:ubiquinol-cytochrome c reductase cytochrome b subunit